MPFPRFTLRSGLIAMLILFALMLSLIGGGSYVAMKQAKQTFDTLYILNVERLGTARAVYADLMETRSLLNSYQTDYNRLRVKSAKQSWAQAETTFKKAQDKFATLPAGEDNLNASFEALMNDGILPGFATLKAWDVQGYQESAQHASELTATLNDALDELTQRANISATNGADDMARNMHSLEIGLLLALLLAIVAIAATFIMLRRHLLGPLNDVRRHLARIADGDLSAQLPVNGVSEMRRLKAGVNAMHEALYALVEQLQQESDALRRDAAQLTEASQALNTQSQDQAQALQQTSASMEEITATVSHTADHAEQGRQLASENRRQIDHSGEQLASAIAEMEEAQSRSQASLEVIAMIDSLAFQTNLLALNASVEAARAGTQGRGFAVVAEEVRSLSARSAEAARTIREQIEGTHQQVRQGAGVLAQAGQTLATAVRSSEQLSELLDSITLACQQQRDGIHQIDQAIVAIDGVTQRNVALAEHTFQATRGLDSRARQQRDRAAAFRLSTGQESENESVGEEAATDGNAPLALPA
ncbi:methyl-accepting chemotaxis protein [Salinicola peritrichatus]|uniref:methyl-accepting chemotaxis protein n=1 Tax=Salinicola peritrichatus TaxID=1267424 RepID=UPI000DA20C20|nr:methyl-accepting chemotaxis protein [Salinicola peritrichatus]